MEETANVRAGEGCVKTFVVEYGLELCAGGRSEGSRLAIPACPHQDKHNQVIFYPHTAQPNCYILYRSLLVSEAALNNIPPLRFIIVSFSHWITQNNPV